MTGQVNFFRGLVLASACLYLLYFFFPILRAELVSQKELEFLELNGYGSLFYWPFWLQWISFAVNILALAGLLLFKAYARVLFLFLVLFFLVSGLGLGLEVSTALESFLGSFLTLIDGAIVALSFTTPIADRFRRDANPQA